MMEAEVRVIQWMALKVKGLKVQEYGWCPEAGKSKTMGFPYSLQKEHSPANTLISTTEDPFQTSDIQNCK